jgi:hypothetical protein
VVAESTETVLVGPTDHGLLTSSTRRDKKNTSSAGYHLLNDMARGEQKEGRYAVDFLEMDSLKKTS